MKALKRIALLMMGLAFVVLALANTHPVAVKAPLFPEYTVEIPLYLLFFMSMALGVILSGFAGMGKRCQKAMEQREAKKSIKKLEQELALLKVDSKIKAQTGE